MFDTPGHTRGHIVYFLPDDGVAFVGDTLFAMGCGRLFEGTPAQMWNSLQKILRWPEATRLYCAHEYTQANARFALTVEPQNRALLERAADVARLRANDEPTIPTTVRAEKATNPFLRPASRESARDGRPGPGDRRRGVRENAAAQGRVLTRPSEVPGIGALGARPQLSSPLHH